MRMIHFQNVLFCRMPCSCADAMADELRSELCEAGSGADRAEAEMYWPVKQNHLKQHGFK